MPPFAPPTDYPRLRLVHSFDELASTRFADGVNALCWPRALSADFAAVVHALAAAPGLNHVEDPTLRALNLAPTGQAAIAVLLEDLRRLRELGLDPILETVNGYPHQAPPGLVRTDVCSFHIDSADDEADTWLCTYHGAPSEALRNEDAVRRVDLPATRAELLRLHGGPDDDTFRDYLAEHFYDLHYAPRPDAAPISFGVGNLWRIATDYPGSPVPPCIHRAPDPMPDQTRLLLIS